MHGHGKMAATPVFDATIRIMWPNIIYMMPLLLTNKYSVSYEIMQYFYDVRYWYIEIGLLDLVD